MKRSLWNVQKDFNLGKKICSFYQHCFSLLSQCSYRGLAKTWIRNLILREATKVFATTSNSFTFALQQFMFWMRYLFRFTLLVIQRTVRDLFHIISKQTKRYIKCFASSRKWNCYGCYIPKLFIRFIIYYGGFCGQVLLDSDWASQLRSVLQFLSQALCTRIVSDDNNRVQFPRFE